MKKNISMKEIKKVYKILGIDYDLKFDVRNDLNIGNLNNTLNVGDLDRNYFQSKKISSYIY